MSQSLIGFVDALKETWQLIQRNLITFLLLSVGGQLLLTFITLVLFPSDRFNLQPEQTPDVSQLLSLGFFSAMSLVFLINLFVGTLISVILIILTIRSSKGEQSSLQNLLSDTLKIFFRFLGMEIAVGLIVIVGFILLIIPGVIFSIWLFASVYVLVDQNKGIIDSLKESKRLVVGHSWEVFFRGFLGVLLLIVGGVVFSLLTLPLTVVPVLNMISQSVLNGVINAGVVVFGYVIYSSLRELKSSPPSPQQSTPAAPQPANPQ